MQNHDLADLAVHSLALYRELRDELGRMLPEIGTAKIDNLLAMNDSITSLWQTIHDTDAALMALSLQPEVSEGGLAQVLAERRQVVDETLALYKKGIVQAQNVKSLLAHDLAAVRAGRQMLNGYAPHGQNAGGNIINRQT